MHAVWRDPENEFGRKELQELGYAALLRSMLNHSQTKAGNANYRKITGPAKKPSQL